MSKTHKKPSTDFSIVYSVDESFDNESFLKLRLRVCHDGISPNKTHFTKEVMEDAKETIKNKPILAHVKYDDDGKPTLGSHDYHVEEDRLNEGEYKIIYDEQPIGVIPEDCNFTIEEYDGKNYVFVDAYIWRNYSNYAEQLLEDSINTKLSMEISIPDDKISFNAKEKYWDISEFKFRGVTMLNDNLGTGMEKALGTTENFSQEENQDIKSKMIILMDALNECLLNYNTENLKEGGKRLTKFEELLQKYNITKEDITFEIDGLTDDELEAKFTEVYEVVEPVNPVVDGAFTEPITEPEVAVNTYTKSFELSHDDIRCGLYMLLQPFEEMDDAWYYISEVYDTYFIYRGWNNGASKIYKQEYKKDGDLITYGVDRTELFEELLTANERAELETMRSNYSSLQSFKSEFEKLQKETILNSEKYAVLVENESFIQLRENAEKYSLEEIEKECKVIFADHVLSVGEFSLDNETKTNKLSIDINSNTEKKPYNGYFDKYLKPKK